MRSLPRCKNRSRMAKNRGGVHYCHVRKREEFPQQYDLRISGSSRVLAGWKRRGIILRPPWHADDPTREMLGSDHFGCLRGMTPLPTRAAAWRSLAGSYFRKRGAIANRVARRAGVKKLACQIQIHGLRITGRGMMTPGRAKYYRAWLSDLDFSTKTKGAACACYVDRSGNVSLQAVSELRNAAKASSHNTRKKTCA